MIALLDRVVIAGALVGCAALVGDGLAWGVVLALTLTWARGCV